MRVFIMALLVSVSSLAWAFDPPCSDNQPHRWVNCGNGTMTDKATGLTWMRYANCPSVTYAELLDWAAIMQDGVCKLKDGSAPGDWRIPNLADWETLRGTDQLRAVQSECYWASNPTPQPRHHYGIYPLDRFDLDFMRVLAADINRCRLLLVR